MKKQLTVILIFFKLSFAISQSCTLNPNMPSTGGILPDTITNLPLAEVNQFYSADFNFLFVNNNPNLTPVSYKLISISGLPSGLSYNCSAQNCEFIGLQPGCANIFGSTNQYGTFPITLTFEMTGNIPPFGTLTIPQTYVGWEIVVGNLQASINGSTICQSDTANIELIINNGIPPYNVTISDGFNQLSATGYSPINIPVSPNSTTNYTLTEIVDAVGGVGTGNASVAQVNVLSTNFNINFNSNVQLLTSPPFVIQFSNNTPNLTNYNYTWYWGDGTSTSSNNTSVFHQYLNNGLYSVTLEATNMQTGCSNHMTVTDYIFTTGGTACAHSSTINQVGPISACSGQNVILSCNPSPTFTYQWRKNGVYILGNNNDSLNVTEPGVYSVIISENGCPVSSNEVIVNFSSITAPIISSSGSIQPCIGGSINLSTNSGYSSYLWSNGATTQATTINTSGNYTVQVTNSNGCSIISNSFIVNASILPVQTICVVGVDSVSNNLRVVWEKPITNAIDSFYIYKETNVSDVYSKVGARLYDSLSVWTDQTSNPAVQAYRYKITALDTCGTETPLSSFHKSIHLTINQGVGGAWNLIWSHYEGIVFGSYNIYRGTTPNNMSLINTIQSNLNTYTDLTAPAGNVYYQIEIINPNNCDPTKVVNYSSSLSNIVTNDMSFLNENDLLEYLIYPNPVKDNITIETTKFSNDSYCIFDPQGRAILSGKISGTSTQLDLSKLARGNYMLQIGEKKTPVKLVKE
jgi:hypothetical protein